MKPDLSDILIILGLLLAAAGLFLISPAIMFIVIGTVIFLLGFVGARRTPIDEGEKKGGD
ncbi:hypothetical protein KO561_12900 [Radiobacillus kanasensis]|uniref:hypothetical protein n=1 Tax=Radiobacillus kanasensis TaxID=2844358 RepID=UPI001E4BF0EE|nr:hypothetical protein [Radiobacillus kanasensis]UFT98100.1 hypothetical protein KO561_12900 [Radiobacillus kanasensis]